MDDVPEASALGILEALFLKTNFVTFERMERATNLSRFQILALKPRLEDLLRAGDSTICLTSLMQSSQPGLFLDC